MYKILAACAILFRSFAFYMAGNTELNFQNFCSIVIIALLGAGFDTLKSKKNKK